MEAIAPSAPPRHGFQSPSAQEFPPIIVLETTTVCNLKCVHCYHGQGYTEHPDYHAVFMEWDIFKKAMDEVAANKITVMRISPAGEALLHPQFLDQLAYIKELGIKPTDLTTNGLTLDLPAREKGKILPGKTILERMLELEIELVDISLDAATKDSYESIRVKSDYHRVWSNIHRFLYLRQKMNSKTKLMLSIIDQPESKDEVEKFKEYWTPLVDRVIVRPYLESLGLTPPKPGTFVDQMVKKGIERWPCPQFWKRVTITPEGWIRFCVVDWLDKSKVGDLRNTTIKELWHSTEYGRLRSCHLNGEFEQAHAICGPCTDWMGMRWDWGFEVAVAAAMGNTSTPAAPPPLTAVVREELPRRPGN